MTKTDTFDAFCSILTSDVPCKLISGSGGNYELTPGVFNGSPFFTLTLPDGYMVRPGDEIKCDGQSYMVRSILTSEDNTELYWAILTRANQQDV
jgi:hypothetical protein